MRVVSWEGSRPLIVRGVRCTAARKGDDPVAETQKVPLYEPHREKWRSLAACRDAPGGAETFHPCGQRGAPVALSYCARCPVTIECGAYAVEYRCARWGTWGGRLRHTERRVGTGLNAQTRIAVRGTTRHCLRRSYSGEGRAGSGRVDGDEALGAPSRAITSRSGLRVASRTARCAVARRALSHPPRSGSRRSEVTVRGSRAPRSSCQTRSIRRCRPPPGSW
jgi:hypothetical protein